MTMREKPDVKTEQQQTSLNFRQLEGDRYTQ